MVLVLGIVKASLEILGIGIGVKKVVLLMSAIQNFIPNETSMWLSPGYINGGICKRRFVQERVNLQQNFVSIDTWRGRYYYLTNMKSTFLGQWLLFLNRTAC